MPTATHKQNKKRPAPVQSGPKTKKPHLEAAAEPKAKKRSRPVTAVKEESDAESSDGGTGDELYQDDDLEVEADEDAKDETGEEGAKAGGGNHALREDYDRLKRSGFNPKTCDFYPTDALVRDRFAAMTIDILRSVCKHVKSTFLTPFQDHMQREQHKGRRSDQAAYRGARRVLRGGRSAGRHSIRHTS